jgi:hypothetical protein
VPRLREIPGSVHGTGNGHWDYIRIKIMVLRRYLDPLRDKAYLDLGLRGRDDGYVDVIAFCLKQAHTVY